MYSGGTGQGSPDGPTPSFTILNLHELNGGKWCGMLLEEEGRNLNSLEDRPCLFSGHDYNDCNKTGMTGEKYRRTLRYLRA